MKSILLNRTITVGMLALSSVVHAEPFVVEDMPADLDSVVHPWTDARRPQGVDFNGDGQASWYAGGNRIAHPKQPTPLDPLRFATAALPTMSLSVCPSCTPEGLAFSTADFNRDGKMDIARVTRWDGHSYTYSLQIFSGTGNDTFTLGDRRDWTSSYTSLGDYYVQTRAADFDGDGDPDIAILTAYDYKDTNPDPDVDRGSLRIRWNNNGAFDSETVLQAQQFAARSRLLVGDFDRDADTDLIVNFQTTWTNNDTWSYTTRVFTNQGAGTFASTSDNSFDGDQFIEPLFFADIDRNSRPEWVVRADVIRRRAHHADTGWDPSWVPYASVEGFGASVPVFERSLPAAQADMDEDGRLDLVVADGADPGEPKNLVLHATNSGNSATAGVVLASFSSTILHIGTGDARGDADTDLLVRLEGGSFKFVRNTAQRLFSGWGGHTLITPLTGLTKIGAGDGNQDGMTDIYALRPAASGSHLEQMLGTAAGGLGAPEFKILANTPSDFTLGDFNKDDRIDFAYVVPNLGAVRTVIQNDSSFFSWSDTKIADYAGAALIEAGNVLNYDARTDLFVASNSTGGLLALRNGTSSWSESNPRTSFGMMPNALVVLPRYIGVNDSPTACGADGLTFQAHAYTVSFGWGQSAEMVQVQDVGQTGICAAVNIDNDGAQELVFVSGQGDLVWWNPTNTPASPYSIIGNVPNSPINALAATDWNRDGLADVLAATDIGLYLYTRSGLAESWSKLQMSAAAVKDLAVVDINRDSRPDAVYITDQGIGFQENRSGIVEHDGITFPAGQAVVAQPGQSVIAYANGVKNPGRQNEDASIAVTGAKVYFKKVVYNGDNWTPGAAMTRAEVEQGVTSVSILMDGIVIGTTATAAVAVDGSLQIDYLPIFGNLVPILADTSKSLQFRVNLKSTAGNASYSEFILTSQSGIYVHVLDGNEPIGLHVSTGAAPYNLIRISQNLFSNGFE